MSKKRNVSVRQSKKEQYERNMANKSQRIIEEQERENAKIEEPILEESIITEEPTIKEEVSNFIIEEPMVEESLDSDIRELEVKLKDQLEEINDIGTRRLRLKNITAPASYRDQTGKLQERIDLLNDRRRANEQAINVQRKQSLSDLETKFESDIRELEKLIRDTKDELSFSELRENLKSKKKSWENDIKNIETRKTEIKNDFLNEVKKTNSKYDKKLKSEEKIYLRDQLVEKSNFKVEEYKSELELKLEEINKMNLSPIEQLSIAKQELSRLNKEYLKDKQAISDKYDKEKLEELKKNKSSKNFNREKRIIPEDKKQELIDLIQKDGFIYEDIYKKFEKTTDAEILENKYRILKAEEIEKRTLKFQELAKVQVDIITENQKILDENELLKREVAKEYNEKIDKLNSNISTVSKESDIKPVVINKVKVEDVISNGKVKTVKTKSVEIKANKITQEPKKESFFKKLANSIKNSGLYKAHAENKQRKAEKRAQEEAKKFEITKQRIKEIDIGMGDFRNSLKSMTESEVRTNSDNTAPISPIYKELDLF
jgi:hypothetical protein